MSDWICKRYSSHTVADVRSQQQLYPNYKNNNLTIWQSTINLLSIQQEAHGAGF